MSESTAYSCPQCRATLKLDPHSSNLICEYCGSSFTVDEIEARVDEVSSSRKKAQTREDAAAGAAGVGIEEPAYKKHTKKGRQEQRREKEILGQIPVEVVEKMVSPSLEEWDDILAAGQQEQFDDMVGYTCTNCGAQVVADKLTVATSCQYCGSSIVVDQRLSGGLKPGFVIPFKLKAEDLPQMLTDFYAKRPLLPKNFFYNNQIGEVQGIYVPFWLYDGTVRGSARYSCQDVFTSVEGKYDVTTTKYYHADRVGSMSFDNIPVDASERIDDDLMDSIEPFRYAEMKEFKAGYLTGFVAERFDQNPRQVLDRAQNRMGSSARGAMRASVSHHSVSETSSHFEYEDPAASYVLLPVYLFNCRYGGKHYRYAVNGQTGKIVGEVPTGKRESLLCFLKRFVTVTALSAVVATAAGFFILWAM